MLGLPLLGLLLGATVGESLVGRRLVFGLVLVNLGAAAVLAVRVTLGPTFLLLGPWGLPLVGDRLGVLFSLLAAGIQATVLPYAARCLERPVFRRFVVLSQALLTASELTGIAGTFGALALGWVTASLAVYMLVSNTAPGRGAARHLGVAFLLGDGALIGALAITWHVTGGAAWSALPEVGASLRAVRFSLGPLSLTAEDAVAVMIVASAIVRSALWPGPRWLSSTLAAPTPVSALLHAGVVNAGGLLLIRLSPLLIRTPGLPLALAAGLGTAVFNSIATVVRSDVKGALVHSTMSQMGFMVAECAVGAYTLAVFHLVAHAMYKASLFLNSGDGIAATVRDRQSSALAVLAPTKLRLTKAAIGAAGLFALALVAPLTHVARGDGPLTVTFAVVTGGALLWGWLERKQAVSQELWAIAIVAAGGVAYLVWSSTVGGWLAAGWLPATPAPLSPSWLVAALVAAGGVTAVVAWVAPPRVVARLQARALWASWKTPSPESAPSLARPRGAEVVSCKESA